MTVKKLTDYLNKFVLTSFVFVFIIISVNQVKASSKPASENQNGIVGVWQLNHSKTGKNLKQMNALMLPLPVFFAPESLILAADDEVKEITINEGFKEFVYTQTLPTDGTTITRNVQSIGQVSAKAFWKNKKLVVEIITSSGDKMTEVFELSSNNKKLNVTLQISDSHSAKITTQKRVYSRMADVVEDNTEEVGIGEYLL